MGSAIAAGAARAFALSGCGVARGSTAASRIGVTAGSVGRGAIAVSCFVLAGETEIPVFDGSPGLAAAELATVGFAPCSEVSIATGGEYEGSDTAAAPEAADAIVAGNPSIHVRSKKPPTKAPTAAITANARVRTFHLCGFATCSGEEPDCDKPLFEGVLPGAVSIGRNLPCRALPLAAANDHRQVGPARRCGNCRATICC